MLEPEEAQALGTYVERTREVITNALHVYASGMEGNARTAMAEYQRGQDDPAVKAEQDASMVANRGYKMSAEVFADSARRARDAAEEIDRLIDGDDADAG